ncbi:MAG: aminomethyl-transferring glycine dehydrogenase subunit GcvPB [Elusimicrobiota bacterium]
MKLPPKSFEHKFIPPEYLRKNPMRIKSMTEQETVRHFSRLAAKNFSLDKNFYPLGSCTMKYNYRFLEKAAAIPSFANAHPFSMINSKARVFSRGSLESMCMMQDLLKEICGMDAVSLQPMAGAQGELTGLLIAMAYHHSRGEKRSKVIVPDTSHGTNPASAAQAGCEVITVPTAADGRMDIEQFKEKIDLNTALVILTLPNTLGLFNHNIIKIAEIAHKNGSLMYCDGANLNAIMGKVKPGQLGFDIMHVNLHKTFGAPHGGGGPGAGPVCVKKELEKFLPNPQPVRKKDSVILKNSSSSIGRMAPFFGNFAVMLKSLAYILYMGADGLRQASEKAVLNANYLKNKLKDYYHIPYAGRCMHEFVLSAAMFAKKGVKAMDIAKYLIDRGIHPPTVYFPLLVKEAMMIEPAESESLKELDRFIDAMIEAAELAKKQPDKIKNTPRLSETGRLNETLAARNLKVRKECYE